MKLFLVTFGIFLLIILAMALGDCDKPCDTLQEKLDAGDENAKAEYEQKFSNKTQAPFYEVK